MYSGSSFHTVKSKEQRDSRVFWHSYDQVCLLHSTQDNSYNAAPQSHLSTAMCSSSDECKSQSSAHGPAAAHAPSFTSLHLAAAAAACSVLSTHQLAKELCTHGGQVGLVRDMQSVIQRVVACDTAITGDEDQASTASGKEATWTRLCFRLIY